MALDLRKIAETADTITLGWAPPPDAHTYAFYAKGAFVTTGTGRYISGARKGELRDSVKYAKGGEPYEVAALCRNAAGQFRIEVGEYGAAPPATPGRWFADSSPWNTPAAGLGVHPRSAAWMNAVRARYGSLNLNMGSYTTAVWGVDSASPKEDHWQPNSWFLDDVPTPPGWKFPPSYPAAFEHYDAFVDEDAGRIWQFINLARDASRPGKTWTEASGGPTRLDGSGFWDNSTYWLCGGSGAGVAGGLPRTSEFEAGRIPHALASSWAKDFTRGPIGSNTPWSDGIKPYISPMTSSDGVGSGSPDNHPPMGVRLVLRPEVDVDSLTYLQPGEKIIVKAIQEFGIYVRDSTNPGGAWALHVENDTTGGGETFNYTDPSKPWYMTSPMDARWLADCYIADEWNRPLVLDTPATFGQPHH
jgi:hypothetical protein